MSDMKRLIESIDKIAIREDENAAAELENIAEQMMNLLEEARQIVNEALRSAGSDPYSDPIAGRMEGYWYPTMSGSIQGGPGTMFSIMSTIEDLQEMGKGPEDDLNEAHYEIDNVKAIIAKHLGTARPLADDDMENGELYQDLFDYFASSGDMPYGTMKARDGDPYEWIFNRLDQLGIVESTDWPNSQHG